MRTVFVGAVETSATALAALIAAGRTPDLVVTLPPDAAHRHSDFVDLTSPAQQAGAALHHTTNINADETTARIAEAEPDLTLVIGWSQICRQPFREIARLGAVGFHPAPLPRLRGRAVIPWTILTDQTETAASLFWLDAGVDSGDLLLQRRFAVAPDETARSLYAKHLVALEEMAPEAVALIAAGDPPRIAQDHNLATYCAKRTPADGLIDWTAPAADVLKLIRAVGDPYPGAFSFLGADKLVIDAARGFERSHQFIGLTGQIQLLTDEGFVVRCGDGACIEATAFRWPQDGKPRTHACFGSAPSPR